LVAFTRHDDEGFGAPHLAAEIIAGARLFLQVFDPELLNCIQK
jgi:hypothetical protein